MRRQLIPGFIWFDFGIRRPVEPQCHLHQIAANPLDAILDADEGDLARTAGIMDGADPLTTGGHSRVTGIGSWLGRTNQARVDGTGIRHRRN